MLRCEDFSPNSTSRRSPSTSAPDRALATVLFTNTADFSGRAAALGDRAWREVLEQHHALVRNRPTRFRGVEVDTAGDGFLASFDGPARAIACACAIVDGVRDLGLEGAGRVAHWRVRTR